jgi:3-isopropylmalate/(R)-2-methylmalate dehydratase small subunit
MAKRETVSGIAAPLPLHNLDTDQIMPKQFLLGIDKSGLARGVLHDLRMDASGSPRPEFVLNRPEYQGAKILVGGANFGCGSSREHAVWGLMQAGFEAVIAPSYGEIFYFNALNNRLLLVMLAPEIVERLMTLVSDPAQSHLTIDVARQCVRTLDGTEYAFELPERQKRMFIEGLDTIGMTLSDGDEIKAFEARHHAAHEWMNIDLPAQRRAAG